MRDIKTFDNAGRLGADEAERTVFVFVCFLRKTKPKNPDTIKGKPCALRRQNEDKNYPKRVPICENVASLEIERESLK